MVETHAPTPVQIDSFQQQNQAMPLYHQLQQQNRNEQEEEAADEAGVLEFEISRSGRS